MFSVLLMELFQVSEDLLGNKTPKTPKCIVDPLICPELTRLVVLTADPRGLGVVDAELWLVQVGHRQPGLAAARKLHWEKQQAPVRTSLLPQLHQSSESTAYQV